FLCVAYSDVITLSLHVALPILLKMKLALLLVISLLLTMEITDWIQLQLHPESYPFGKGDLPWYYHNQICYQIHLGIMISYLSLRSEEHTSELQSRENLVCRLLL